MHPTIGHVHLKVSDLERSIAFYQQVLGMTLTQRFGPQAAFLAYGDYHHHLGLNTWQSQNGAPPPRSATGLFHLAVLFPTKEDLLAAVKNVTDHGITIDGSADHGVSEAYYFRDPDQNGIEIYWDKPRDQWPFDADGNVQMR